MRNWGCKVLTNFVNCGIIKRNWVLVLYHGLEKTPSSRPNKLGVFFDTIYLCLAIYRLIPFENQIQTTSASPCRTQVQPAASFLVCSLIFIEYKKAVLTAFFAILKQIFKTFSICTVIENEVLWAHSYETISKCDKLGV